MNGAECVPGFRGLWDDYDTWDDEKKKMIGSMKKINVNNGSLVQVYGRIVFYLQL